MMKCMMKVLIISAVYDDHHRAQMNVQTQYVKTGKDVKL